MQTEFRIFLINWPAGPLLAEDCLNLALGLFKISPGGGRSVGGGGIAVGYELERQRIWTGQ